MAHSKKFILVFFVLLPALVWADEKAVVLTETVQLQVADGFMNEKEYYRAITEYLRFRLLFPDSERVDYAFLQVGKAYLLGGEPERAAQRLRQVREKFPTSTLATQSWFLEGLATWKGKKSKEAQALFEALANEDPESVYAPRALAAIALIRLEADDPKGTEEALDLFGSRYPDNPHLEQVRAARHLVTEYRSLPQKSEILAGILSGIIPGAGYAYAEEFATGAMSLGVNGAFIGATWTAFANGLEAVGILAGGIGLPFYIGNIYGSALAVRKWNQAVKVQGQVPIFAALDFVFD
ncbi:MAG TPA: tetratricopeptide repeat protein [Thermodesulfobacteriota bacterium]|nr:tetratricopeptide repeat protein [Thermodesulfobacteriota bacterium]